MIQIEIRGQTKRLVSVDENATISSIKVRIIFIKFYVRIVKY